MNRTIVLALTVTGTFQPLIHAQGSGGDECATLTSQAFEAAGVNFLIASLPAQLMTGLDSQIGPGSGVSPSQKRQIEAAFNAAFHPSKTGPLIRQEFLKTCDPDTLRSVLASLNTPLALKMREMEVRAETPLGKRQLAEFTAGLTRRQPDHTRVSLIQKLDASTRDSAFATDIALASVRGMGDATGQIPQGFEATFRKQITGSVYNSLIICMLSTYRDASDADLVSYTELSETSPMAHFSDQYQKAFLTVIEKQTQVAFTAVMKFVAPPRTLRD